MGNRAVITFKSAPEVGIYLHWNGGPESVLAFIETAKNRGARSPGSDSGYALAGLIGVITSFIHGPFDSELLSVGVGLVENLNTDNYDNGLYIIDDDWMIVERKYAGDDPIMSVDDLDRDWARNQYDCIMHELALRWKSRKEDKKS